MAERKPGKFAKERQFIKDKQIDDLKTPPHSLEAEQSVLGGLLLSADGWDAIAELVSDSDFYRSGHRLIFRQIAKLAEAVEPVDVITVADQLDVAAHLLDGIGVVFCEICCNADQARGTPLNGVSYLLAQRITNKQFKITAMVHQPVEVEQALIDDILATITLVFDYDRKAVFVDTKRVHPPAV